MGMMGMAADATTGAQRTIQNMSANQEHAARDRERDRPQRVAMKGDRTDRDQAKTGKRPQENTGVTVPSIAWNKSDERDERQDDQERIVKDIVYRRELE